MVHLSRANLNGKQGSNSLNYYNFQIPQDATEATHRAYTVIVSSLQKQKND